jgi:hypothetical protein
LFCSRLTAEIKVFHMIRLKAWREIENKIDINYRFSKLRRKNLIKLRKPKLIQTITKAISHTDAILL